MKFFKFLSFSVFILSLFAITYSLLPSHAYADDSFAVDSTVTYRVDETGKTLVTHDIALENLFSTLYATTYTLSLENINALNVKSFNDKGLSYPIDIKKDGSKTNISVNFSDSIVGRGSKRHFVISYENSSFAAKTGEVWEISIPKLADANQFRSYQINLIVPDKFGAEAYVSPKSTSYSDNGSFKEYSFLKNDVTQSGVTAGFGQFQVFSFNLFYHLENPLAISSQTEIALPPDTAFQKVYFANVTPKPDNLRIDEDGNWIALFKLSARQRVDVNATGSVQIFSGFRPFYKPSDLTLKDSLLPTDYWQINDTQIKLLAASLKTPEAIYNYVSKNLKYDFNRVQPNVQRVGALGALQNPTQAICMEFTDLFIALARAAGIPAREVNGYAYTENPQLQPLSLVADVLHAWPEYYDKDKGVWIPVDPTWGATSGVDYFNKLDLRHFAFVIHGKSDKTPYPPGSYKLGPNPQKDVYVSFGQLPVERNSIPKISLSIIRNIPFLDYLYNFKIENPGPSAMYTFYPTVYFDDKEKSKDFVEILPPFANYEKQISVPFSILGKDTPDNVRATVDGVGVTVSTNKTQIVINSLLVLSIFMIVTVLLLLVKLGKIRINVKKIFTKNS